MALATLPFGVLVDRVNRTRLGQRSSRRCSPPCSYSPHRCCSSAPPGSGAAISRT
ncbi:MAG: hypothetical protein WBV74_10730 [Pseudonocardiaceae bacterium]